jgi:hypothetical protein
MKNALSNGDVLSTIILMMVKVQMSILFEAHKASTKEEALVAILQWLHGIYIAKFCTSKTLWALLVSDEFQS